DHVVRGVGYNHAGLVAQRHLPGYVCADVIPLHEVARRSAARSSAAGSINEDAVGEIPGDEVARASRRAADHVVRGIADAHANLVADSRFSGYIRADVVAF